VGRGATAAPGRAHPRGLLRLRRRPVVGDRGGHRRGAAHRVRGAGGGRRVRLQAGRERLAPGVEAHAGGPRTRRPLRLVGGPGRGRRPRRRASARRRVHRPGAAYVFRRSGGVWVEEAVLAAPVPSAFAYFGSSVALDGHLALVGARGDGQDGPKAGATYVFSFDGAAWSLEAALHPSVPAPGAGFGTSVALEAGRALAGAPGADGFAGACYVLPRRRRYLDRGGPADRPERGAVRPLRGLLRPVGAPRARGGVHGPRMRDVPGAHRQGDRVPLGPGGRRVVARAANWCRTRRSSDTAATPSGLGSRWPCPSAERWWARPAGSRARAAASRARRSTSLTPRRARPPGSTWPS
jgi:hypothetical protein